MAADERESMGALHAERLVRPSVEALDAILGKPLHVLNDGFVRVVDYLGSDASIVQAARVSYGAGTKRVREDRGLIRHLLRHGHTTPFEMCEIKLHVRVPMDCWRQWIRHRTANVNEYSTRYSVAIDSVHTTLPSAWRYQSKGNRQGSEGTIEAVTGESLTREEAEFHEAARRVYERRLERGIAREQARKDLPLSTYTEAYWKIDLHNLLHFLQLRMDAHAQDEIRAYAHLIGNSIVSAWCPVTWEAFLDYRVGALILSGTEAKILASIAVGNLEQALLLASDAGWISPQGQGVRNRERQEFEAKLTRLNLRIPWELGMSSE